MMNSLAWSCIALTTLGWQWPVEATPIPVPKLLKLLAVSVHNRAYAEKPNLTAGHIKVFLTICGPDVAPFSLFGYKVLQVKLAMLEPMDFLLSRHDCRYGSAPNIFRQLEQDAC